MTQLGYHASHEQFAPSEVHAYVRQAEAARSYGNTCSGSWRTLRCTC